MMRIFFLPSILLLLIAGLAFFSRSGVPPQRQEIVFANAAPILSRDVTQMTWSQDIRLAMGLYEGLAIYDPKTTKPDFGVAEAWEPSNNGQTWTFHLRQNARWSNGDAVTSHDFIFAWKRALTLASACQYVSLYMNIKGAQAYYDAQDPAKKLPLVPWNTVGIHSPDDHTLIVDLSGPCSYFLDLMAFPTFFPLHEPSMHRFLNAGGDYDGEFTLPGKNGAPGLVSNGPFKLTGYREGDYHILDPNEFYWDRSHVLASRIKMVTRSEPAAALVELANGSLDVLSFVPASFAPDLLAEQARGERNNVHMSDSFGTYYYLFNCTPEHAPFNDPRVRLAFSLVIDKQLIVDKITRLHQTPINTITPPNSITGYTAPHGLDRDSDRARKLLAEAGFPDGKGLRPIELLFNTEGDVHKQIAQAVGQMWQRELNAQVTYKGVDNKTFRGLRQADHAFDVCRAGWNGDYNDPVTWLDLFRAGDGNNDGRFSSKPYDALLDQAAKEFNAEKRFALLQQAEKLLTDEQLPFIPLYQYKDGYMYDPDKIAGMDLNVRLLTQLKFLHRREDEKR